jgi:staphylococcal nuclease domain-containing protein 1
LIGKVVEIIEANQYLIKTDKEVLNIKLDRIFIEGLEAKEFARKLLIGKKVHILQVGDNLPLYTI